MLYFSDGISLVSNRTCYREADVQWISIAAFTLGLCTQKFLAWRASHQDSTHLDASSKLLQHHTAFDETTHLQRLLEVGILLHTRPTNSTRLLRAISRYHTAHQLLPPIRVGVPARWHHALLAQAGQIPTQTHQWQTLQKSDSFL